MKPVEPILRGDSYYIRRRVPHRFAPIEPRGIVQISLFTDSLTVARRKAPEVWAQMIEAWEAKLAGKGAEGDARLDAAMNLAHRRGYRYLDAADVAALPLAEILARIAHVTDGKGRLDMAEADAVLGLPPKSVVKVSDTLEQYYRAAEDRVIGKTEAEMQRHRLPRRKAINNFLEAVEDMEISALTDEDMHEFRRWLTARVRRGKLKAASANKDITHINAMFKAIAKAKGFKLGYDPTGLALSTKGDDDDARQPFSDKWIKEKLLAPGALDGMNAEARLILLGMINTGYRPGEGAGLLPDEIRLDSNVPHIIIQPNRNRALKNSQSKRTIPLTGISLEAFRQAPKGFPRFASGGNNLSRTVNDFLRRKKLLETPDHVMYSLRHSFEDRMLEAGIDERIRRDLLGHKLNRERYGAGGSLEHVHGLLSQIAL